MPDQNHSAWHLLLAAHWASCLLSGCCTAGDRNIEKRFRKWLGECHGQLDKHIRFEGLGSAELQVLF